MTRIAFSGADSLMDGITLVTEDLDIALCEQDADLTVCVIESDSDALSVTLRGNTASITWGGGRSRFFRALAMLVQWFKDGMENASADETPIFPLCGSMVDMSRNAVMNVPTVKAMMRRMALMGMNAYMLYTEDTYEIDNRPYFGYMRGRYTPEEIRDMDAYAARLGIELIPCIQTLGHLATHLRWSAASRYKDTERVMLTGAEETYHLIDDMFRTIAACFTSRRLHIGMDETHDLGTGKYLDLHGYRLRDDLYFEHLHKVTEIAHKYGFAPMMWSDMFFRTPGSGPYYKDFVLSDEKIARLPDGLQQVFWDYYNPDEEFYAVNIDKHKRMCDNPMFAGGVWFWSGHCPLFARSLRNTIPALDACRKKGIREVIATVWHNGSESSLILSLAGLAWYADYTYHGCYDENSVKACFRFSCGEDYDTFMKAELPEHPDSGDFCSSRAILYNDPLIGLLDRHIAGIDTAAYYRQVSRTLHDASVGGMFAPAYAVIRALSELLINKADFGIRLKAAYDQGDRKALAALAEECDIITEKLHTLRLCHRESWMLYNKPFGWEVHDIRYGGLLMRFNTAKERILAFLAGDIDHIEELEAERLRYDGGKDSAPPFGGGFLWQKYPTLTTPGIL